MSHERLKNHLRDVAFTTAAPFSEDGDELLYDELARNTEFVMDAGGRTFIPCGNTGEYYSLTDEERVGMVETTVDTVGDDGVVVGGVAGSTKEAIDLIEEYERVGADGVMVHDPDHTYIHRRGIVEYYRRLAASTDMGIVLYKRGPELSTSVLEELAPLDNVVGLKYAVNDIKGFSEAALEFSDDIVLSTGIAERFAPAFALEGAEGFTTGIGSFVPEVSLALMDALRREDWERAREIRDLARPYENLREEAGADNSFSAANNVPAIKYGLELAGLYGGPVREPIVELTAEDERRAEEYYDRLTEADLTPGAEA
jgi:4-hydroxy-tetrahydrodipicolinate synthase